jgi:hypothetical protein
VAYKSGYIARFLDRYERTSTQGAGLSGVTDWLNNLWHLHASKGFRLLKRSATAISEVNKGIKHLKQRPGVVGSKREVRISETLDRRCGTGG